MKNETQKFEVDAKSENVTIRHNDKDITFALDPYQFRVFDESFYGDQYPQEIERNVTERSFVIPKIEELLSLADAARSNARTNPFANKVYDAFERETIFSSDKVECWPREMILGNIKIPYFNSNSVDNRLTINQIMENKLILALSGGKNGVERLIELNKEMHGEDYLDSDLTSRYIAWFDSNLLENLHNYRDNYHIQFRNQPPKPGVNRPYVLFRGTLTDANLIDRDCLGFHSACLTFGKHKT